MLLHVRGLEGQREIRVPTDVGLGEAGGHFDPRASGVKLARGHALTRNDLQRMLERAAARTIALDEENTQKRCEWHRRQSVLAAGRLVDGDAAALARALDRIAREEISSLLTPGTAATIELRHGAPPTVRTETIEETGVTRRSETTERHSAESSGRTEQRRETLEGGVMPAREPAR